MSELNVNLFSASTILFKSAGRNACELVIMGEKSSIEKKIATLGISKFFILMLL